jgi:hypothetical protein
MMFHVMLAAHDGSPPTGLCGAAVSNFYLSKVRGDGKRRPDLCPVCRALALKTKSSYGAAETGSAGPGSMMRLLTPTSAAV